MALNPEKQKALELALSSIEKQFGKGAVMKLGTNSSLNDDVGVVSTGSLGLDIALGIGGIPKGRIIEIFGPEASGKTTISVQAAAECQKQGGTVAYIDAEHALDVGYARKLGLKVEDVLISQPDTGEQALEIADMLVRSGGVDMVVVDSVAALVPRAEIEGEMGDSHMGLQARLMSQALRKLTGSINRSNTIVIFINQLRMKIGVMFGSPETTTGGNALKFYASVRLDIRRIAPIKNGDEVVGSRTRVKVVKNKMAAPFKQAEFDMLHGQGTHRLGELVDIGSDNNIIEKSGSWFSYKGERIGQGRDNAVAYIQANPDLEKKISAEIFAKFGIGVKAAEAAAKLEAEAETKATSGAGSGKAAVTHAQLTAQKPAPAAAPNGKTATVARPVGNA